MAFNQTPGRGNFPKTGSGLPDTFRQDTNPPLAITTGPKFTAGVENYQNDLINKNQGRTDIKINPTTSEASANKFERKITNEGGMTRIIGSGGQTYYGRTGSKDTANAIKASESKVNEVNSQRSANANHWNVNADVKSSTDYTEGDKKMLLNLGKAKKQ
jgi:hypothetical protein